MLHDAPLTSPSEDTLRGEVSWVLHPDTVDTGRVGVHAQPMAQRAREFLALCSEPARRNALLCELELALADSQRQVFVLGLVHAIRQLTEGSNDDAPLRVVRIPLRTSTLADHVDIVLLPSIFGPEDWSYTFLEGLLRKPPERYAGKTMIEVGAGSGWVSIAMLRSTALDSVIGLDLNPLAVMVGRINAFINSYDERCLPRYDAQRRLLHERIVFRTSNLLEDCLARGEKADFVVGCIPQVLAPSPDLDPDASLQQLDDERLYELSNYFVLQGVYEDQFGLGLLAKTLEQAVYTLQADGRVILNIAGRPGSKVIERMFTRRGFHPHELWNRRVRQAEDTDIDTLAQLEVRTKNPFEFYMNARSREPIGATTAHALRATDNPIWHDLRVIEASLEFERELGPFYEAMRSLRYGSFVDQLDLSSITREQVAFLRRLAQDFSRGKWAPYSDEYGCPQLRGAVARFVERYFDVPTGAQEVFVGPSREELAHGLLRSLCEPGDTVLLGGSVHAIYAAACDKSEVSAIIGNDDVSDLTVLAAALCPKVIILALSAEERRNFAALRHLLEVTAANGQSVIIDDSEAFEISSAVRYDALFDFVGRHPNVKNLLVLIGLIRNQVYPTLRPALLLLANPGLREAMAAVAEATYSRNNTFTERYYLGLFDEIMSFQLEREAGLPHRAPHALVTASVPAQVLSQRVQQTLALPAFVPVSGQASVLPEIRLDWGENELAMPDRLVQGTLLGFTNLGKDVAHQRVAQLVAAMLSVREGHAIRTEQVVVGPGVFPLLFDAAVALRRRLGRAPVVAVPSAHYGNLLPIFTLAGCTVERVETAAEHDYLWSAEALERLPKATDVIVLVNPNNPVGVYHSAASLDALLDYLCEHPHAVVFADEIFVEIDLGSGPPAPRLAERLRQRANADVTARVLRFNGLSKMLAAGGLRVGWVQSTDTVLLEEMVRSRLTGIEAPARVATEVLLRGFAGGESERQAAAEHLEHSLVAMRDELRVRRSAMVRLLEQHGLSVARGTPGGLFVFPSIRGLYGRKVRTAHTTYELVDETSVCQCLLEGFGLRVNPGAWAGAPGHVRMCFSLRKEKFEQTLRRLSRFFAALDDAD